ASSVRIHFGLTAGLSPGIDCHHNALTAEAFRALPHQARLFYSRCVQGNFVGTAAQNFLNVIDIAQSAADGEWNIDAVSNPANHLGHDVPAVGRSRDVEKDQLIGAFIGITQTTFNRVPCITQLHEIDALYNTSVLDIETGNDALSEH